MSSLKSLRWAALTAAVCVYALIVLGAVVRTTGSGLSCPDWPTCYGHWVPLPSDIIDVPGIGYTYTQVMLEWVHRAVAGFVVGPLLLLTAFLGVRARHERAGLLAFSVAVIVLLLIQGALGGITVLDRNSPWSVAVHLGNALLLLTVVLRLATISAPAGATAQPSVVGIAAFAWGTALLAMATAAVTAKSGASLACTGWPLCEPGVVVPDLAADGVLIHFTHRVLAGLFAISLLALWLVARRAAPGIRRQAALAVALVCCQIVIGAAVIIHQVPIPTAVLHQAMGVLTFAVLTHLMWRVVGTRDATRTTRGQLFGETGHVRLRDA